METGDILLFQSNFSGSFGWWAWVVSFITHSKWTHVAIILKDPTFIDESYKGLYVLECGSENWEPKWGVMVSPLAKILQDPTHKCIAYRQLNCEKPIETSKLEAIYTTIAGKAYDTDPLELAGIQLKSAMLTNPRKLDKFVCSTLIAYVYTALGLLPRSTNWFFFEPWHFSTSNADLQLVGCDLGNEILL